MEQILANYQSDSGSEGDQIEVSKSRKRKAYTTAFKIEAIEYAKKVSSVSKAAKSSASAAAAFKTGRNKKTNFANSRFFAGGQIKEASSWSCCPTDVFLDNQVMTGSSSAGKTAKVSIQRLHEDEMWEQCGITVCHDGSEDYFIHGPVPEGRLMLLNSRAGVMEERAELEEIDPQQDEENGCVKPCVVLNLDYNSVACSNLSLQTEQIYAFNIADQLDISLAMKLPTKRILLMSSRQEHLITFDITSTITIYSLQQKYDMINKKSTLEIKNLAEIWPLNEPNKSKESTQKNKDEANSFLLHPPTLIASNVERVWIHSTKRQNPHLNRALWINAGCKNMRIWLRSTNKPLLRHLGMKDPTRQLQKKLHFQTNNATSSEPIPDPLLPNVVSFIKEFPEYLQTMFTVLVKLNWHFGTCSFRSATIQRNFQDVHEEDQLDTATSCLILLQSMEPTSTST
uniref:Protein RIC1 homolog n=1 Tax=Ditylenchus dipsaci TaxID=166011 RepID=A0A915DR56_9BILA